MLFKDFEFHIKRGLVSHSLNYKVACANITAVHLALEKEGQEKAVLLDYSLVLVFGMLQSAFSVLTKDLQHRDLFGVPLFSEAPTEGVSNESWMWLPFVRVCLVWMLNNIAVWKYFFDETTLLIPDPVSRLVRNYFWRDFATFFNTLRTTFGIAEDDTQNVLPGVCCLFHFSFFVTRKKKSKPR